MVDKIKLELASVTVNYGEPQSSLLGSGNAAVGLKKNEDGSQTEIDLSDAGSSNAQTMQVRLLKFDTFLSLFTMITKYSKQLKPQRQLKEQRQELYRRADWDGYRLIII